MAMIKLRDKDGNVVEIPTLVGESAYSIAVKNGFVGTEVEWIESLKGTDGISPSIRTIEAPKGYVLEIIDANGENYISLFHGVSPTVSVTETEAGHDVDITDANGSHIFSVPKGKDGTSPTISVTETDTGHDVNITDYNGSHTFSVPNGLDGTGKITVKYQTYGMDYSDGVAYIDKDGISFYLYESLPQNRRIIDFKVTVNGIEYMSSELFINGLILPTDTINTYPKALYDSSYTAYIAVFINSTSSTLYKNIAYASDPSDVITSLTLYYVEEM